MKNDLYFENVLEKMNDDRTALGYHVLRSEIRLATENEILEAEKLHKGGACPHNIVYDVDCNPYCIRICHTCGQGLGTI